MKPIKLIAIATLGLACWPIAATALDPMSTSVFPPSQTRAIEAPYGGSGSYINRYAPEDKPSLLLATTIEAIPGSIVFPRHPQTKLTKAPVGSPVFHQFHGDGRKYREIYVIQPDRSLKLVNRTGKDD